MTKDNGDQNVVVADRGISDAIAPYALAATDDDPVIEECFIVDDDTILSAEEVARKAVRYSMRCFNTNQIHEEVQSSAWRETSKSIEGTAQQEEELGFAKVETLKVVSPPYPPELLAKFLEVDETHFRCVKAKVLDSIGRAWSVGPQTTPDGAVFDPTKETDADRKNSEKEILAVRAFLEDCNDIVGFEGVLHRAAMDYEAIGWGAIEVVRSIDGKIRRLAHIPASRVRVLKGWKGFVEIIGPQKFIYYQKLGAKIVNEDRKDAVSGKVEPYSPREDGELNMSKLEWNLVDRNTGERTTNLAKAANELIWIPRHHSNTIYYGMTDVIPALGHLLANIEIRDFLLQYFEHNTVPQYAIIIEGAKIAEPVKETILKFFSEEVKGKAHKTLIIPVPSVGGEVKVRFERLSAETKEGSFQATRKNNRDSIMTAHGVSPAIIGIADAASLGSGKGLSQAEIYKDRIVTPSQRNWEMYLNKLFRVGLGVMMVKLEFEPLDIRDRQEEQTINSGYIRSGAKLINEVRQSAKIGDALEGGNRAFSTDSMMFVDEMTEATSQEIETLEMEVEDMRNQVAQRDQANQKARQNQDD